MQNSHENSNNNAGRAADLTTTPGYGSQTIKFPVLYPFVEFYSIPDEYKNLAITDSKYMITNWSAVKDKDFQIFYQNPTTLAIWSDQKGVQEGFPITKVGVWPSEKMIPREHVKIETRSYYTLKYKLRLNEQEYEESMVYDSGRDDLNPKIIGKRLIRGIDDVAIYIGPITK